MRTTLLVFGSAVEKNQDAVIECTLTTAPDFENQDVLIEIIEKGVEKLLTAMSALVTSLKTHANKERNSEQILAATRYLRLRSRRSYSLLHYSKLLRTFP